MFKKCVLTAALAVVGVLCGLQSQAQAQEFPGLGVGGLWEMNQQFDNQFYPWAWEQSVEVARHLQPGEQLPFNAMTISRSISDANESFEGYVHSMQDNSARTDETLSRFDQYLRGVGNYVNPDDNQLYELPYTQDVYNLNRDTQVITPGYSPYDDNLYPEDR
jgi:hypothetical protein